MIEEEVWAEIPGFSRYVISNMGMVMNVKTSRPLKPYLTPQGVVYVPMYDDTNEQCTRSLKLLVAKEFVDGETDIFDTPINKDGDKRNNRADNLLWRPRWFAIKYSRQFKGYFPKADTGPVFDLESNERFETVRDAAIAFGLLFRDVYRSTYSENPVFPTRQVFRIPNAIELRQ